MNKLLIVSRCHEPRGGADRIVADLCRNLPQRGWSVTLGLVQGLRFNQVTPYRELYPDLPIVEVDARLGTRLARQAALRHLIRTERPDVVLSMRVCDVYEAVAAIKRQAGGPRLAVGVRAYEPGYLHDMCLYRDNVDLCVTSGVLIERACRDLCGIAAERVVSIAGGVRKPVVSVTPRLPRSPLRLMYAGRLEQPQKRVLDLVPFLEDLSTRGPAFRLDIFGTGPAEGRLRDALARFMRDDSVKFHGWVAADDLYRTHYPAVDCFVHFAAWEGVTIAPREAMAHGVVPIISRFVGQRVEGQFVDGMNALTFDVGDPRAAARCARRLSDEPDLFERLSRNAIHSQRGPYTFEGSLDAWAEALDSCLARPPMVGPVPTLHENLEGRLTRWRVPGWIQARAREGLRWPVCHQDPGSEWPTSTGLRGLPDNVSVGEFAELVEQNAPALQPA